MSLRLTHTNLLRNVENSRSRLEKQNKTVERQMTARLGGYYGEAQGSLGDQETAPRENYYYRWTSYVVPQLTSGTPRVDIETTRAAEQGEDALYLDLVCNRWIEDVNLSELLADGPATDMQHDYAVTYVTPEEMVGEEPVVGVGSDVAIDDPEFYSQEAKVPWQPKVVAVPHGRYFRDMIAITDDEVRFEGHTFGIDRNDLKEEDGWDLEVCETLNADDENELEMLYRPDAGHSGPEVKREELVFHEVWVRGADPTEEQLKEWGVEASDGPNEGFNGWLFTLAAKDDKALDSYKTKYAGVSEEDPEIEELRNLKWPRKPRPFYGPEWGPYQLFRANPSSRDSLGTGPLLACEGEIQASNLDSSVVAKMIRTYKRMILLNGRTDDKDVAIIKDGQHDNVYRVKGLDKDGYMAAEIGGVTDQVLAHLEQSKTLVEETLGLDRMHSGSASSSGNTATRDAIADSAASIRFSGVEQGYLRGLTKIMRTVAWYYHEDNRMVRDLGSGAAQMLGMQPTIDAQTGMEVAPQPRYFGGRRGSRGSFRSLHVSIQPHSIRHVSEGLKQQRAMHAMGLVAQVVPMSAQFPAFPWAELMEFMGDQLNIPTLGKLFREDNVNAMADDMMAMSGGMPGGMPSGMPSEMPGAPMTGSLPGNRSGPAATRSVV